MESKKSKAFIIPVSLSIVAILLLILRMATPSLANTSGNRQMESLDYYPELTIIAGQTFQPGRHVAPPESFLRGAPRTASISVNYIGTWDSSAQTAFGFAVSIWETMITSTVPIVVDAEWASLGPGILGSAGANSSRANFTNAPQSNTWYPIPLANKIAGSDLDPGTADIHASFNKDFTNWYLGTDGNPPGTKYDFVSVVLHEIGHGLGFSGSMVVQVDASPPPWGDCGGVGNGCWGYGSPYPFIYDRFTENGSGQALLGFSNNSAQLGAQLISDNLFFNGTNANAANSNSPPELYAPTTWNQGSSYAHLGEIFNGTPNALMTYSIGPGESNHAPGPVMMGMFTDMGWEAGQGAPTATPTPTTTSTPTATPTGPTPTPTQVPTNFLYLPVILRNYSPPIPGAWQNIVTEDFEGAFPGSGWVLADNSSNAYTWDTSNCQVDQGSFSGWPVGGGSSGSGLSCGSNYPSNMDNWMLYGPFSLVNATAADLTFRLWINTEQNADYLCRYASVDGSNFFGTCTHGNSTGWIDRALDLSNVYTLGNLLGEAQVWIALQFQSDGSIQKPEGAFVDDIVLRKCPAGTCPAFNRAESADLNAQIWEENAFVSLKR